MSKTNTENNKSGAAKALDTAAGSLIERWLKLAESWEHTAEQISIDTDLADRAIARASIYQDCADDLRKILLANDKDSYTSND